MNVKKILLASAFTMGCLFASAQQADQAYEYVFTPHWYGQLQVGGQETLGEGSFGKLLAPNAQVAVGYQFNPLFGLRLNANAWQSKGTMDFPKGTQEYWKWNYVAPALDLTFNLTNAIGGYNPTRLVDLNVFAGVGVNVAWNNDEAVAYNAKHVPAMHYNILQNIWDGTKARLMGQFGLGCDFRVSDRVKLGVELSANFLSDTYNSKHAGNADWYFNGLVGVKYAFGPTYTKKPVVVDVPVVTETQTVEVIKEVPVEVVKEIPVAVAVSMERNVFFTINSSVISLQEGQKVKEIAEYMKENPDSKVHITGYADKGTGTLQINLRLARERAQAVATQLQQKYGIAADRISTSSMTNHEFQPFEDPVLNRVAICVAE